MRLFPVIILITFAVAAIKIFSIAFDQNPIILGAESAIAAENEPEIVEPDEVLLPSDERSKESQKAAIAEAERNTKIELERIAAEDERSKNHVDALLESREKKGTTEFFTDTEIQLLQSLKARRDKLDDRERKIDLQAKLLQAAEQQLDSKIKRLTALETVIKQKLGEVNDEEVQRFSSLVKTYETMKPKEAAGILSVLEISIMEKIARSMSTKKLAPILAKMDLTAARALTIRLAQPPKELTVDQINLPPLSDKSTQLPEMTLE